MELRTWPPTPPSCLRPCPHREHHDDYTSDLAWNSRFDADPLLPFNPSDVVAIIRRHKPLFAPGAKTEYADSNYVRLGIILQKVTGRSVESVITRDVITRAGLRAASFPTMPAMLHRSRTAITPAPTSRAGSVTTRASTRGWRGRPAG
jgi:CubicO group peptidase (beta-lactamase class C family)